jgi:tRNA A-37 threonylcarbamoyl transferase component Bud32
LEPSSVTVLRELASGFELEHHSGRLAVHELAPGVILQEFESGVADDYFAPVAELAQRRINEGVRVTLVSDITRSRSHTPSYRRAWSDWISEHAEHLDAVLVLLASPLQRMAVNTASAATGGGMFRGFTDIEAFQAAVEQAVLRAELAAAKIERLSPVILRGGSNGGPDEPRLATLALDEASPSGTLQDHDQDQDQDEDQPGERLPSSRCPPHCERLRSVGVRGGGRALNPAQPRVGSVLAGAYRLDERIGKGGMGTVYRGCQLSLERDVAIKLIRLDRLHNPETFVRFRREVDLVSRLSHPNIVQVIDAGSTDTGVSYLVMELLTGQRLDLFIRAAAERSPTQSRGLAPALAIELFGQICAGVEAAHAEGLIHRDLSPANVFVRLCGDERPQAKILDFGLAKPAVSGETDLTLDGQMLGTPGCMAPEQIDHAYPADARTDIYALGVLLYAMLSGRRPFVGESAAMIISKQLEGSYAPLANEHQGFAAIIAQALARDPEQRPPSVAALWAAVQAAAAGEAPAGRPEPGRAPPVAARGRARGLVLGLLVLLGLLGLLGLLAWLGLLGSGPSQ